MVTLQERLSAIHKGFVAKAPSAAKDAMARATEDLVASGIAEQALGVGDPFPDFELPDAHGRPIASRRLRGDGPLVLTVFRGHW